MVAASSSPSSSSSRSARPRSAAMASPAGGPKSRSKSADVAAKPAKRANSAGAATGKIGPSLIALLYDIIDIYPFERARHIACAEGLFRSQASSGPIPPTRHPPAHHQTNIRQGQLSDAGTNKCTGFEGLFGMFLFRPTVMVTIVKCNLKLNQGFQSPYNLFVSASDR